MKFLQNKDDSAEPFMFMENPKTLNKYSKNCKILKAFFSKTVIWKVKFFCDNLSSLFSDIETF